MFWVLTEKSEKCFGLIWIVLKGLFLGLKKGDVFQGRMNVYIHRLGVEGQLFAGQLVPSQSNSEAFDQTKRRHQGDEELRMT